MWKEMREGGGNRESRAHKSSACELSTHRYIAELSMPARTSEGARKNQMCTQKCVRDVRSAYSAARGSPQDVCPGGTIGARRGTELEASS